MFQVTEAKKQARSAGYSNRAWSRRSRVHVFQAAESIMDNLVNRRSRPSKLYKEVVLDQFPELAGRIKWSQTAGCACGCSPGFIVDDTVRDANHTPVDFYITAKFS